MSHKIIWSNKVKENNLCLFCANYMKKRFFCIPSKDDTPIIICKYFSQIGTPEFELDLAMIHMLEDMLGE